MLGTVQFSPSLLRRSGVPPSTHSKRSRIAAMFRLSARVSDESSPPYVVFSVAVTQTAERITSTAGDKSHISLVAGTLSLETEALKGKQSTFAGAVFSTLNILGSFAPSGPNVA